MLKFRNRNLFSFFLLSLWLLPHGPVSHAQQSSSINRPQVSITPPSPEAAKLGEYGEVPIGYYTGSVQLSIPVTNIKVGDISVPVSIDYSSGSGFRVGEVANSAGLGWSISAVGVVTRSVVNVPDDINGLLSEVSTVPTDWLVPYTDTNLTEDQYTTQLNNYYRVAKGMNDLAPDIFYYNFNGISGKFYFNRAGQIINVSGNNVQIAYTMAPDSTGFRSWTITTQDGLRYTFSETEQTVTQNPLYSPELVPGVGTTPPAAYKTFLSAWYLSRISDLKGNSVSFTYLPYSYIQYPFESEAVKIRKDIITMPGLQYDVYCPNSYFPESANMVMDNGIPEYAASLTTYNMKKLATITGSDSTKVTFVYNTDRTDTKGFGLQNVAYAFKSLDSIYVSKDNIRNKWALSHDYSTGRLSLTAVRVLGTGNATDHAYTMSYFDTIPSDISSKSIDHWGYFNGKNNGTLIPSFYYYLVNTLGTPQYWSGANRDVDTQYASNGLLRSITYPTGGKSLFEYEQNQAGYINGALVKNYQFHPTSNLYLESHAYAVASQALQEAADTFNIGFYTYLNINTSATVVNDLNNPVTISNSPKIYIRKLENGQLTDTVLYSTYAFGSETDTIYGVHNDAYYRSVTPGTYVCYTSARRYKTTVDSGDNASVIIRAMVQNPDSNLNNLYVGGARIRKITNIEPYAKDTTIKNFDYTVKDSTQFSSGVIYGTYNYQYRDSAYLYCGSDGQSLPAAYLTTYDNYVARNLYKLGQTAGSHIGYRWVTITEKGKGKTSMNYTSPLEFPDSIDYNYPYLPAYSISYKTGNLLSKYDYSLVNNQYLLVHQTSNQYRFIDTSLTVDNVFYYGDNQAYSALTNSLWDETSQNYDFHYWRWYIYYSTLKYMFDDKKSRYSSGYALPVSETETSYLSPGNAVAGTFNAVTTTKYLRYRNDYPNLLAADSTTNSDGKVHRTEYGYAMDETTSPVITAMIGHHMVGLPVTTRNYVNSVLTTTGKTGYGLFNGSDTVIAPMSIQVATAGNPLVTQLTYNRYDSKGHVLSYTERGGKTTLILWGYNNTYPVAEIQNVDETAFNSYMAANTGIQATLDNPGTDDVLHNAVQQLRNNFPNAMITGYAYKPLTGVTSQSDVNNVRTSYEYDSMGRLSAIRDFNGNVLKSFDYQYESAQ